MNSPPDLYASEYRGPTNIPAHYIYRGGRFVSLNVPRGSLEQPERPAVLVITTPECQVPAYTGTVRTVIHLNATKLGPGSEVSIGVVGQEGKVLWGKLCVLNATPYQWQWFGPLHYGYYVVTVPFDVVTFPIQLPIYGFYYMMGRGMSPR
jgi:hypothetical protein